MPIRYKLLLVFLPIILIPLLTVGFFSYQNLRGTIESNMRVYTADVLTGLSEQINIYTQESGRISFLLLSNQDIQNSLELADEEVADYAGTLEITRRMNDILLQSLILRDNITYIDVVANNGAEHTVVLDRQHIANYHKLSERDVAALLEADGGLVWFDADPGDGLILAGRLILSTTTMKPIGYLAIAVKESSLRALYDGLGISENGRLFIINSEGSVISHPDSGMLGTVLTDDYIRKILGGAPNQFRQQIGGVDSYVAYRDVPSTGWKIVNVTSENLFLRQIVDLRASLFVLIAAVGATVLVISLVVSSTITKPILQLSQSMELVGEGRLDVVSAYKANDEIGVMSRLFNQMMVKIKDLLARVETEELLKNKAELMSLRMQVNPHFLYNTLESINWAARAKGADDAANMVKALGNLMRTSIGGEDFVPLEQELENISNYMLLQNYRFKGRFAFRADVPGELLSVMVPNLILQPLLENSILHGFDDIPSGGEIVITGGVKDGEVILRLSDNGAGIPPERLKQLQLEAGEDGFSERIGLRNVHRRIQLYYGKQYGLRITSREGEGTAVEIRFPYREEDADRLS